VTVVELLGLPGVGKTSVVSALESSGGVASMSRYRSVSNVVAYSMAALRLAPVLVAGRREGAMRGDGNKLVRLESSRAIVRTRGRGRRAFVFDQGPLFLVRQLERHEATLSPSIDAKRSALAKAWARALDLVVVLDASDEVLLRRIRARGKTHPLQAMSEDEARRWLNEERLSFDHVLDELHPYSSFRTEHIDTSDASPASTADAVLRSIATSTTS
jgi:broad-specificity NMP kinase